MTTSTTNITPPPPSHKQSHTSARSTPSTIAGPHAHWFALEDGHPNSAFFHSSSSVDGLLDWGSSSAKFDSLYLMSTATIHDHQPPSLIFPISASRHPKINNPPARHSTLPRPLLLNLFIRPTLFVIPLLRLRRRPRSHPRPSPSSPLPHPLSPLPFPPNPNQQSPTSTSLSLPPPPLRVRALHLLLGNSNTPPSCNSTTSYTPGSSFAARGGCPVITPPPEIRTHG